MLATIRRHLGIKIFLSYLVVILVGTVVVASTAELVVPTAFERHMAVMSSMMSSMMGGSTQTLDQSLYTNFRAAVTEALGVASLAANHMGGDTSPLVARPGVRHGHGE